MRLYDARPIDASPLDAEPFNARIVCGGLLSAVKDSLVGACGVLYTAAGLQPFDNQRGGTSVMPTQTINGHSIYYLDQGEGAPMLCMSNSISDSVDTRWVGPMFEDKVRGSGYRLIMPDYLGMGKSARSADLAPNHWADDLVGLLDALSISSAHIVSENLSTRMATRIAADNPDRVKSLVLTASIAKSEPAGNEKRNRILNVANMPDERRRDLRTAHGDDWEDVVTSYCALHDRADFEDYYDLYKVADQVKAPTLIVRGDIDEEIHPLKHTQDLHRLIPGSWLAIYANMGYDARTLQMDEYWRLVSTFLKERAPD